MIVQVLKLYPSMVIEGIDGNLRANKRPSTRKLHTELLVEHLSNLQVMRITFVSFPHLLCTGFAYRRRR